jgi:hypothetical protein
MKNSNVTLFAILLSLLVGSGCAATAQSARQAEHNQLVMERMEQENAALREQLAASERARVAANQVVPPAPTSAPAPAPAPAPQPAPAPAATTTAMHPTAPVAIPTEDLPPPPAHTPPPGPPQNWFWMYEPPMGCEGGSFAVKIQDWTGNYTSLRIDGKQIQIMGAEGPLPKLPPHAIIYGCLDRLGKHTMSGISYQARYTKFIEVDRFNKDVEFRLQPYGQSQTLTIDATLLYFN